MTRSEIFSSFRGECPEITDRVINDTLLAQWAELGDKVISAGVRCIILDNTFTSIVSSNVLAAYDLSVLLPNFYDIDTYPGGGVLYDDDPLEMTTVAELDMDDDGWRSNSAGTPEKFYRRGKNLYFDCPIATASTVRVYYVGVSDDFDSDGSIPFNGLTYLEPFHYSLVLYLVWRAKGKVGKPEESQKAFNDYSAFIAGMKKTLSGNKFTPITFRGPSQGENSYGV